MDFLFEALPAVLAQGAVLAFGAERTTEIVKQIQRWIVGKISKFDGRGIEGFGSAFVALVIVYVVVANPNIDINVLADFDAMGSIDKDIVPGLNILIFWAAARWIHSNVMDRKKPDEVV